MKRQTNTQQIIWFLDLHSRKLLELDPPYQRHSVWSQSDRGYFLETIFKNYPCPALFLNHQITDDGVPKYNIIDGKQRLQTIISFSENELRIPKNFADNTLSGKSFDELAPEQKKIFWQYSLIIEQINSDDIGIISEMFDRFNRNAHNLNAQELRHAKYNGWFITEATLTSQDNFWSTIKVTTITKVRRMKDVQFISELIAMTIEKKIFGFDQDHLDEIYATYDDPSKTQDFIVDEYTENKNRIIKYIQDLIIIDNSILNKFISINYNLYTLWNLILLHEDLMPPNEFAPVYSKFISEVNKHKKNANEADHDVNENDPIWLYHTHSTGATTDHGERLGRYNALKDYLKIDYS